MSEPLRVVLFSGIGDHVLWLGLLPAVRARKPVHVTCAPAMQQLAELYAGRSFDRLTVRALPEAEIEALKQGPAPDGTVIAWHGAWRGDEHAWLEKRGGTVADVIRDIIQAPDAEIVAPEWTPDGARDAELRCWFHMLPPGRTVLLAPFAHTAPARLPDQWWVDAAEHLTGIGLTVCTNVANRARGYDHSRAGPLLPAVPGTIAVDVSLAEIGPFAERCGFVLCARSGLSDLLARANVNMTVVWPYDPNAIDYQRRHFDAWSVRRIYNSNAREVWVPVGDRFSPGVWGG